MKVRDLRAALEGIDDDLEVLAETADYFDMYLRNGLATRAEAQDCDGTFYFVIGADIDKPSEEPLP